MQRVRRLALVILVLGAVVAAALWAVEDRGGSCLEGSSGVTVCAASDMARLPPRGAVPLEGPHLDLGADGVLLHAARNETVAFQLILSASAPVGVDVRPSDLEGEEGVTLRAEDVIRSFLAHYVLTEPAGYSWGPASPVLPWPEHYPDALVPFRHGCLESPRTLVDEVELPSAHGPNQSLWFDIFVPRGTPPGEYSGRIDLEAAGDVLEVPVTVMVRDVTLAERPSVDAVGEIYDPYLREGIEDDLADERWRRMAHCYQQMAHRHRMVFIERTDRLVEAGLDDPDDADAWRDYDRVVDPILNGELFTRASGYIGPGEGVPVAVWRTPWPQVHNGRLKGPLPEAEVKRFEGLARAWDRHALAMNWTQSRFFAYIFDEIDGVRDYGEDTEKIIAQDQYLRMAHVQIELVQRALDSGATEQPIDLIWTSHSNPGQWEDVDGLDLGDVIRLWAPNAMGASPEYLGKRAAAGDRIWFYHAGHPHVGAHSINVSGIDMRTWGVIAARYGFDGQLMWAVNFGDREDPYGKPSYKNMDDRFGNGTVVYPGAALPSIGHESSPGPIPSMRLKAWRRGLQDADLVEAARRAGRGDEVDELLRTLVPRALGEGRGEAAWPQDSASWHRFRMGLLELAEQPEKSQRDF